MKESKNENELSPPNILIKLSWGNTIKLLNDKEKATILTNIYHYHTGEELKPMTKAAQLFFSNAIEVFDYNIKNYRNKVEANRENGAKGGRPSASKSAAVLKNPTNPDGLFENPNNLKDKEKDKPKEKDILKAKLNDITKENDKVKAKNTFIESINENNIGKDKSSINPELILKLDKFKKIANLECDSIKDEVDRIFCIEVKELVNEIGWDQFFDLILSASYADAVEQIKKLGIKSMESSILDIRRHHNYFLNKLIK